jgi:hypothetical protein
MLGDKDGLCKMCDGKGIIPIGVEGVGFCPACDGSGVEMPVMEEGVPIEPSLEELLQGMNTEEPDDEQ